MIENFKVKLKKAFLPLIVIVIGGSNMCARSQYLKFEMYLNFEFLAVELNKSSELNT